ncbi:MAG TPA: LysM peptidoglycan-binding domain-containing protein [Niallia sp.]|nr:LysM peptidoglycan-binding domain-containing protein [Niallia sp.]
MKKEDPYRVKAELHKQKISKVSLETKKNSTEETEQQLEQPTSSSLPSRSSMRQGKKRKVKTPLISFLPYCFILLPILLLVLNSLLKNNGLPTILPTENSNSIFEKVSIEKETTDDVNKSKVKDEVDQSNEENDQKETEDLPVTNNDINNTASTENNSEHNQQAVMNENVEDNTDTQTENNDSNQNTIYHQVIKGETLYTIAMKYYPAGDGMEKIKEWNNLTSEEIQAGQILKIVVE